MLLRRPQRIRRHAPQPAADPVHRNARPLHRRTARVRRTGHRAADRHRRSRQPTRAPWSAPPDAANNRPSSNTQLLFVPTPPNTHSVLPEKLPSQNEIEHRHQAYLDIVRAAPEQTNRPTYAPSIPSYPMIPPATSISRRTSNVAMTNHLSRRRRVADRTSRSASVLGRRTRSRRALRAPQSCNASCGARNARYSTIYKGASKAFPAVKPRAHESFLPIKRK